MIRSLLVLALTASLPATTRAQFTTYIPPLPRTTDSAKAAVAAAEKARTDSSFSAQVAAMKTWVDSAAGVAPPLKLSPGAPAASVPKRPPAPAHAPAAQPTPTAAPNPPLPAMLPPTPVPHPVTGDTVRFSNGIPAPETASDLPLLALIGAALLTLGAVLLSPDDVQPREAILARRNCRQSPDARMKLVRALGMLSFASGGFLVAFTATRYVSGDVRADRARRAWSEAGARQRWRCSSGRAARQTVQSPWSMGRRSRGSSFRASTWTRSCSKESTAKI